MISCYTEQFLLIVHHRGLKRLVIYFASYGHQQSRKVSSFSCVFQPQSVIFLQTKQKNIYNVLAASLGYIEVLHGLGFIMKRFLFS